MTQKNIFFPENIINGERLSYKKSDNFGNDFNPHFSDKSSPADFLGMGISKKKIIALFSLAIIFISSLFAKSFVLQILDNEKYAYESDINRIRMLPIVAERGILYDRNMKALLRNIPSFYFTIIPNDLPKDPAERERMFNVVSESVSLSPTDIEERLAAFSSFNYQSIPIKNNLTYDEALKIEIINNEWPALQIESGISRQYGESQSLAHILGYLRRVDEDDIAKNSGYLLTDDIGKAGLEAQYEKILRGTYGKKQIEVDALGRQTTILAKEDPKPGRSMVLTIDLDLQLKTEEILQKHLTANRAKKGTVIISDVSSGEILTMVSLPGFDNNLFSGGLSHDDFNRLITDKSNPLFNRAIAGEYPSGSTVKPVFAAAALEEEIIKENTTFLSSGGIRVGEWFFPDWKAGGHGTTNVRKALAESVNTFFYIIGGGQLDSSAKNFTKTGLGVDGLATWAKKFGLGEKLGIDMPGEAGGFLPSKEWKEKTKNEVWYIGDTYHLAIGQGDILVTPLQVNFWTLAFANGGILYQPRIVKSIITADGGFNNIEPIIKNINFISKKNIDIVAAGLRDGVVWGSSRRLADLPFEVAGKTGTAEWGKGKKPHAWFTGFAPYENPKIAITVLVEEGGEGSAVAVPIAKEILWQYFNL